MFLKLFPRYAGRARRGATVASDHLRGTAVVVENAPKSLSRHDGASVIRACRQRCEEFVAETLVVPFCVIVHYVFGYRCAQVSLTERYEAVETASSTCGEPQFWGVSEAMSAIRVPRTRRENTVQQRDATLPGGDLDPGPGRTWTRTC